MTTAAVLKSCARNIVAHAHKSPLLGAWWYLLGPRRHGSPWGGPFNGQSARQALFRAIVEHAQPQAVIETGTFLGTTTEFLATAGLPVFTIEADRLYYGFSRARFRRDARVRVILGDSRSALRALVTGPLDSLANSPVFVYLDAHWNADLPLAEEIDIVFSAWPAAIVMIDDFLVPEDAGYRYDDYGPGKALELSYLKTAIAEHGLAVYFPATPSAAETGARRGCVVLTKGGADCGLKQLPLLAAHAAAQSAPREPAEAV